MDSTTDHPVTLRWLGLTLAILVALVVLYVVVHAIWYFSRTSAADVRSDVEANLASNASANEILAYLDRESITHSGVSDENDSQLEEAGYKGSPSIGAILFDTWPWWSTCEGSISIRFVLDEQNKMIDLLVDEEAICL